MKKIITAIVLILACLCTLPPAEADAKTKPKEYSGTCGENATWRLDKNGTLTISGTGAITTAGWRTHPDLEYWDGPSLIKSIVIANGITEIGKEAFPGTRIKKLQIPSSVKKIGDMAFYNNVYLTSVSLPEGLECIEEDAFYYCSSLTQITIPSTVTHIGRGAFGRCYDMKKIVNLSSQSYKPERALGKITWKVGKKKVRVIPAGQTATSTRKKYKVKYILHGGKLKGKRKTSYQFYQNVKLPKAKKKGYVFLGWSEAAHFESILDATTWGNLKLHAVFKKVSIKKIADRKIKVSVKPTYSRLVVQYSTTKDFNAKGFWTEDGFFESTVGRYATDGDTLSGIAVTKKLKKGKTYYIRWGLACEMEDNIRWFGKKKIKM